LSVLGIKVLSAKCLQITLDVSKSDIVDALIICTEFHLGYRVLKL